MVVQVRQMGRKYDRFCRLCNFSLRAKGRRVQDVYVKWNKIERRCGVNEIMKHRLSFRSDESNRVQDFISLSNM